MTGNNACCQFAASSALAIKYHLDVQVTDLCLKNKKYIFNKNLLHSISKMQITCKCFNANMMVMESVEHLLLPNLKYARMLTLACSSSLSCCSDPGLYLIFSKLTTRLLELVYRTVLCGNANKARRDQNTLSKHSKQHGNKEVIINVVTLSVRGGEKKRPGVNSFFTTGLDYSGTLIRKYFGRVFRGS